VVINAAEHEVDVDVDDDVENVLSRPSSSKFVELPKHPFVIMAVDSDDDDIDS
jgi:hypothetical protein